MLNFDWAFNKVKMQQAQETLAKKRLLNPSLEITEDMIKAEYIARAGLLVEDKPEVEVDPISKAVKVKRKDPKDKEIADLKKKLATKKDD